MTEANITVLEAKTLYGQLNDKGKKILTAKFGEIFEHDFKRIKTFEDACKHQNVNPDDIIPFKSLINDDQKCVNAQAKMIVIARAINNNIDPDWDNDNERKYYPYFEMSGVGFSDSYYGCWYADTTVGSRLSYRSENQAVYAGKTFLDIYKDLIK